MTQSNYFNDAPILTPEDDRFGIDPFAKALARSIQNLSAPIGATIAINGPWGSGKSSAVNLIRHHLSELEEGQLDVIDFKCWWFRGEEALTLAFLQELNATLGKSLDEKAKELIPKLSRTLLQTGPVVGPAINIATGSPIGSLILGSMSFAKRFFSEGETVESLFQQISEALKSQDKRFLVIIDDIDRLTLDEALLIFRLVKSVGRLPNVIYLLVFDRDLAEKAVNQKYPTERPHFLEKIIQASFEVPLPAHDDLNSAVLSEIEKICGVPADQEQILRLMNIFYDVIAPNLNTPRDLIRLSNMMSVSWPAVADEVNIADYVALEVMRLFDSKLYNAIRTNKDRLCGLRSENERGENREEELKFFLGFVSEKNREEQIKSGLMRLFPRLENMGYSSDFLDTWREQRLVCTEEHFDTYFKMAIGDEALSRSEINTFIERCGDIDYVKGVFKEYVKSIRKNGKSKVPLLLDELNTHAAKIERTKFQNLISAIFQIADEIARDQDRDRGTSKIGDNHLRIHWFIRKLMFDRTDLDERTGIFLAACQSAQLSWLVDFTRSAISDHSPSEERGPQPSEKCLVKKELLDQLKKLAVRAIEKAGGTDELILNPNLLSILFRWKDFIEDDGADVKNWTNKVLKDDVGVAQLAKAFTGESWSQGLGMFGLGDRVSMKNVRAQIDGLEEIIDVELFRRRLEELVNSDTLEDSHKEAIKTFLEAWRKRESGKD